jgi:hypothetical protein
VCDKPDELLKTISQLLSEPFGRSNEGEETRCIHLERYTWELLSNLSIVMPRLEEPDVADWDLVACKRGELSDLLCVFLRAVREALEGDRFEPALQKVDRLDPNEALDLGFGAVGAIV